MKRFAATLALSLLAGLPGAHGAELLPNGSAESAFRTAFPKVRVDAVHPTPVEGLFEVVAGENVLYFAPATGHLLFGELWSKEGVSLTAARKDHLLAEKVARLPLDRAVKLGDGPTVVIEVTDPDCPFCRMGSDYLKTRNDVTRYVFFQPLPGHPRARAKARYILAASDPASAYAEVFSGRYDEDPVPEFAPTDRLEEHLRLVEELGTRGTPHYWIATSTWLGPISTPSATCCRRRHRPPGENSMRTIFRKLHGKTALVLLAATAAVAAAGTALALPVPAAGDLGYDIYTLFMDIKDGPVGYAGAGIGIAGAAFLGYKSQWIPAVGALLGTGAIVKADTIVQSLGALIG